MVHANSVKTLENIKGSADTWLDQEYLFPGDALLITGNLEPELKLLCTKEFAKHANEDFVIDEDTLCPRALFATAGCIGAGLDSSNAHSVIRMGFPSSAIDIVQEMGRCGRERTNKESKPSDNFTIVIDLNDYA